MSLFSTGLRSNPSRLILSFNRIYFATQNTLNRPATIRNLSTNARRTIKSSFKLGLAGVTVGAVVGTGYTIHQRNKPRDHILNEEIPVPILSELPQIEPSRRVRTLNDQSGLKLTLYQYQTCPFCCKVRAFLDYYGISYDIVEVDPVLRQSIKWSQYKKVPILVAQTDDGYQPFNDSSMIISAIASYLRDRKDLRETASCYPFLTYVDEDGVKKSEIMNKYFIMMNETNMNRINTKELSEERKWRKWADDVLVHTLSPNVYRTKDEAFQAFNWFAQVGEWERNFPAWERQMIIYVGAGAMWLIGKRLKKKYNLKEDVRQSLYDECNYWTRSIANKGTKFMGGEQPNLSDLAVFGVLNSIEGCTAFGDLLANSNIRGWYVAMKDAVGNHRGAGVL